MIPLLMPPPLTAGEEGSSSSSSHHPPSLPNILLLDKILAAVRLWVPLLPLPPGPLRVALLRDLGAYILAAWETE
jgi:hypothetical protein